MSFGGSNGKNPNPSSAPSALRSITRSVDRNGHRYADGNAGYDMVLAKEQNPNPSQISTLSNKMVSFPSFISDNGTMTISTPERFGPWGGTGGTIFDDGIYTGVRQITITRGLGISSMKVLYDRNGQAIWGNKRGTSGAARPEKIVFDFPTEILTHVTGYFGPTMIMGPAVIKSITFHTTKKSHGPFGDEHGTFFSSCLTDGRIVGFHGRDEWYVDSIGVHVLEGKVLPQKAADTSPSRQTALALPMRDIGDEVTYGVVKEPIPIGPGPWGGEGGKPWDDGVYTGVKQIYITRNEFIGSIQIEYDRSGQSIWSTRHGDGGQITHRIKLDYPHEVLTCIYGYYNACAGEGPRVLRSITVVSSRGKYGPFGDEVGTYFTSATTQGKVVGFHGRSALYLDAIGVHMQHWLGDRNTAASNPKTSSNSKAIVSSSKAAATTTTSSKYTSPSISFDFAPPTGCTETEFAGEWFCVFVPRNRGVNVCDLVILYRKQNLQLAWLAWLVLGGQSGPYDMMIYAFREPSLMVLDGWS